MPAEDQKKLYYPELDGLRFFAFLLVFINHAPYLAPGPIFKALHDYGWIGVDLFLCLSAFLITRLLMEEYTNTGTINIRFFYFRRMLKIWPLYFLFIIFLIAYYSSTQDWSSTTQLRIIGLALFSDNILSATLGYNHLFSAVHLWTISYEEQFYVLIPWAIRKLVTVKNKSRSFFILFVFIILSSIRILFIYQNIPHPSIWVLPITHFEAIFGGTALGLGVFDEILKKLGSKTSLAFGILSTGLATILPNTHVTSWNLMLTYPLVGLGITFIIYSVLQNTKSKINIFLRNKEIVSLGKISYGLYVYHILCLTIANQVCLRLGISSQSTPLYPITMFVIGMAFVILFSRISYHLYEKPFLILKDRFTHIKSRPI
ncbi:MAG: acyltransferase [Anaerolineales bacterium]|nr:acyltransferase [Anaerolineales bacterium]